MHNGEYQYECYSLQTTKAKNIEFVAERHAARFYGYGSRWNGVWEFYGGEVSARVDDVKEIPEEHYNIVKQYL